MELHDVEYQTIMNDTNWYLIHKASCDIFEQGETVCQCTWQNLSQQFKRTLMQYSWKLLAIKEEVGKYNII